MRVFLLEGDNDSGVDESTQEKVRRNIKTHKIRNIFVLAIYRLNNFH